MIRQHSDCWP
uniref:Uncharacterized protein n=1 Tax=Anguilla anguilla TaxID=7936 RepID=A0A0E9STN4_ANGAN